MARVKFSSLVSSIDGSINGNTLQRNAYGNSIRNKPIPTRSQSATQNANHVVMYRITQLWNSLSEAQRNAFDRFLSYSPDFAWNNSASRLSGYNLYLKWQYYILKSQGVFITDIVYSPIIKPTFLPAVVRSGGTLDFNPNPASADPNVWYQLRISPPAMVASAINSNRLKTILFSVVDDGAIGIVTPYYDTFGVVPESGQTLTIGITAFSIINPIIFSEQLFNITVG